MALPAHGQLKVRIPPDPISEQFLIANKVKKETEAASNWESRWGFLASSYCKEIIEEEAEKEGFSKEQYYETVRVINRQRVPAAPIFTLKPSPVPYPQTTNGLYGRRARLPLEIFGRLVKSYSDYPLYAENKPAI